MISKSKYYCIYFFMFTFLLITPQLVESQMHSVSPEWSMRAMNHPQVDGFIESVQSHEIQTAPVAPGIDTNGWGVYQVDDPNSSNTEVWIRIWDYNGVSADGSSHTVIMYPPSGSPVSLEFDKRYTSAVSHKFCGLFWQFEFLSEGHQIYVAFARRGSLSITACANRAYA